MPDGRPPGDDEGPDVAPRPPTDVSATTVDWGGDTEDGKRPTALVVSGEHDARLQPDAMVDHFRLVRLLGVGGMGEVHLARDTKLGRKVALKVVRPERLGTRDALERFLMEARTTARFSHPNIVTIHAVGESDGLPYVALEYLEGQTLQQRLDEGRLGLGEAIRSGLAIAEALAEAHRHGVLHRDLKPGNVLIPPDGRLRVVDFGLAKVVEGGALGPDGERTAEDSLVELDGGDADRPHTDGGVSGTPSYMSPEQWKNEAVDEATDLWALGVTLHLLVTGEHPYVHAHESVFTLAARVSGTEPLPLEEALESAPADLRALIERCLDKDPARRPTATEVVQTLEPMLLRGGRALSSVTEPYRGLHPFDERHVRFFFGRDEEIAAFLERMRVEPVLPVLGPSGAGKTSFVQAGVIPRLREQGSWTVLSLRPGARPFFALASALLAADRELRWASDSTAAPSPGPGPVSEEVTLQGSSPLFQRPKARDTSAGSRSLLTASMDGEEPVPAELARELRAAPRSLVLRLLERAEAEGREGEPGRVVLFVDQLEELFSMVDDPEEQAAFLEAICTAADDPVAPVRVIFTIRDDFLGHLATTPAARAAVRRVTVLQSPEADALEEILVRPLQDVDHRFEDPELVQRMIRAVQGEVASLPLLQFTARALWERRDRERRLLLSSAYDAIGGVEGALARHADGVLEEFTAAQRRVARELLLRLVTTRAEESGRAPLTRQVLPRGAALEGLGDEAEFVLGRLARARLVSVRKGRDAGGGADDAAELELVHESLIHRWEQLRRWIDESRDEIAFLAEASRAAALWEQRGRRPEEVWRGEALAEARRVMPRVEGTVPADVVRFLDAGSTLEERLARRKRGAWAAAVVGLAVLALASLVVNLVLADKERETQFQKAQAELGRAEAWREGALAALVRGDRHEARAKLRGSLEALDSPLGRALWWRLSRDPLVWNVTLSADVYDLAYTPDGRLAIACADNCLYLFSTQTGDVQILRGHEDLPFQVAVSPDGERLASGDWSGEVRVWEDGGAQVRVLEGHQGGVSGLRFLGGGERLASATFDGEVRLWDLAEGGPADVVLQGAERLTELDVDAAGRWLVVGDSKGGVMVWDRVAGGEPRTLLGHDRSVNTVAVSADGRKLATAGYDTTVRIWDLESGEVERELQSHTRSIWDIAFSPDGTKLASVGNETVVRLWDLTTDVPARLLEGHTDKVYAVAFSPDGRRFATAGRDRTVRVWDTLVEPEQRAVGGHVGPTIGLAFHPDGAMVASGGGDDTIRLWDVDSGETLRVMEGHTGGIKAMTFTPDGTQLVTGGGEGSMRVWNVATGVEEQSFGGHKNYVTTLTVAPDGERLASTSMDRTVRLWDLPTGTLVRTIESPEAASFGLAWSPDGRVLANGSGRVVALLDPLRGTVLRTMEEHTDLVRAVAFSPDGGTVASAGQDDVVRLWDRASGRHRVLGPVDGRVWYLDWHPAGTHLGVPSSSGLAHLMSLDDGTCQSWAGHRSEVNGFRFSPDGTLAATTSDDGTVRLWDVATGRPAWRAPVLLPSPPEILTHRGWASLDADADADADGAPPPAGGSWRSALERYASRASRAGSGGVLCLATHDGELQLWDVEQDRVVARHHEVGITDLLAVPGGCVTLAEGAARLHVRSGEVLELAGVATAVGEQGGDILVASAGTVAVHDGVGALVESVAVGSGVSAVTRSSAGMILGFADGNLELVVDDARSPFSFEGVPNSPVVRLEEGPMGTVIAGFASGHLGLWDLEHGSLLDEADLHGSVLHLLLRDQRLYAATDLGDVLILDLGVFHADYCELMGQIWGEVPVRWEGGHPVLVEPDPEHRCQRD